MTKLKTNVIVQIDEGVGESALFQYYGESTNTVIECLNKVKDLLGDDPFQIESILSSINKKIVKNFSAKVAINMVLHDRVAKRLNIPLRQLLGWQGGLPDDFGRGAPNIALHLTAISLTLHSGR